MLAFLLVAKALTILGPLLVLIISICDREDGEASAHYWATKVRLWQLEREREDALRAVSDPAEALS